MKLPLTFLFCLLTLATYAQSWPRNSSTGRVEFVGTLPWPKDATTDSARQALAWRWYVNRLTTEGLHEVEQRNTEAVSKALLTYAGLPKVAGITEGRYYANCQVDLVPSATGLFIYLHDITLANLRAGARAAKVETKIGSSSKEELAALAALRARLVQAAAKW